MTKHSFFTLSLLPLFLCNLGFSNERPAPPVTLGSLSTETSPFELSPLPYKANSLEPAIDERTMRIHHGFHHQAYVDNLNRALEGRELRMGDILAEISSHSSTVRNNAGGHWNHAFFWSLMTPERSEREMPLRLKTAIEEQFGSLDEFKEKFESAGLGQFGSGWAWLIRNKSGDLEISATPNQDNPLMNDVKPRGQPILGVDVWEHAYYLKYQNRRGEYLKEFWSVVNWQQVDRLDREALALLSSSN